MPFFLYEIFFVCTDNSLEQWSHKWTNYLNVKCIYGDYGHNTLQFNSFPCKITSWLRKQNAEGLIHPSILFNFPNLQFKFYTKKSYEFANRRNMVSSFAASIAEGFTLQ